MVNQSGTFSQLMGSAGGDPDKLWRLMNIFKRVQEGKSMMSAAPQGAMGNVRAMRGTPGMVRPQGVTPPRPGSRMPFQQQRNRRLAGV